MVANPGSIAEMGHMAAGLATAGVLERYVTPLALDRDSRLLEVLPGALANQLRRRTVPDELRGKVDRAASLAEVGYLLSARVPGASRLSLATLYRRDRVFDRRLAERVRPHHRAIVATWNAAERTLVRAAALGVPTALEYPIAHHRFARDLLTEEARLQPRFAATLQHHDLGRAHEQRLDREIALADRVLVLSEAQRRTFVDSGVSTDKLVVTHLGVDGELFRPAGREVRDRPFRVVFVGQLSQRKGLSYLLEGFERAALPDAELLLVGRPVGTDTVWRDLPRVRHIPHVPRHDLPGIYATADVFAFPTLVEGFPQTPLEAMACGLPVVVSQNAYGEDVVRDGTDGYVIGIRDADAVADRLTRLHGDAALRERMGLAARDRASSFTWPAYGARVAEVLRALAAEAS